MIAALLLAAGDGRRFGGDKLIASLPDGSPLALAALRALRPSVDEVFAVVRADAPVAPLLGAEGARLVVASGADRGIGHSIAAGAAALMGEGDRVSGCVIALADMPLVRSDTVARLAAALRLGATLAAPEYRGSRGHPLAFGARWFPHLAALTGDNGVRDLLAIHRLELLRVPVDDPGILTHVDRPADLEVLLAEP